MSFQRRISIKGVQASDEKVGHFLSKKIKFNIVNWATRLVRLLFQEEMAARRRELTSGQMLWFGSTLALAKNYCQTRCAFQKWKRHTSSQVFSGGKAGYLIYFHAGAGTLTAPLTDNRVSKSLTGPVFFPPPSPCCSWATHFHLFARKWRAIGVNVQEWRITHSLQEERIYIWLTQTAPTWGFL